MHARCQRARGGTHTERQFFSGGHKTVRLETFKGNEQAINFYSKGVEKDPNNAQCKQMLEAAEEQMLV